MRTYLLVVGVAALLVGSPGRPALALVISEINYHPTDDEDTLEFVEIQNDSTMPQDISGYRFVEGIQYEFPPGTILPGKGFFVVAADPAAIETRHGLTGVLGPFGGKLDNSNDRITLVNHAGAVLQSVRYRDAGKWPVGADGTGHTLVLRSPYLDSGEPESWALSPERGGSPGRANFPTGEPQFRVEVILEKGANWRIARGREAYSTPQNAWTEVGFDDSLWETAPSGFGFADDDDATVLPDMLNGYVSIAARTHVQVTAEQLAGPGQIYLAVDYDDGFCAYVNGQAAGSANCGPDSIWSSNATARREAGKEELFKVPAGLLVPGDNTIAILGLNFRMADNDFSLIPRLVLRTEIVPEGPRSLPVVFNELQHAPGAGAGWFELWNGSQEEVDLSGLKVTDDPARTDPHVFAAGTRIPAQGFLLVGAGAHNLDLGPEKVQLFLLTQDGYPLAASTFDRTLPDGSVPQAPWSECRFPDGGSDGWITLTPTPGAANQVARTENLVINEIFYNPPEERPGEFLELFNRGTSAIDLGGFRLNRGVDYTFPRGTTLAPGGYLVVAEDPAILREVHGVEALGPYEGQLANDGENVRIEDPLGNVVVEVRYADGGRWSPWADGLGSSLELIDARQDASFAAAWEASDESKKAAWEEHTFHVENYAPTSQSELHLFLVERGACHVDDVSITRDGGENLIPNGGFEVDTKPWLIQGTHIRSQRIIDDSHSGAACLEVTASGKGDTLVNRIETDTRPAMTRGAYDVSLWTRWIRGASVLVAHGEYSAGAYGGRPSPAINLSGNSLSSGLRLTVPRNLGTPGAENSVTRRLREATGSANLGPVLAEVKHSPVSPTAGLPVHIQARARDADGVSRVVVKYALGSAKAAFSEVELLDDGSHGDGEAGDGLYAGELPGLAARAKVVFHVEATDARGAVGHFPVDAPQHTCVFMVLGPVAEKMEAFRVVLDGDRSTELSTRALHSNDLVDGTMLFNDEEVYYNVGVRYRGSPWGRPSRLNFRVRLQDDERYHRGRKAVNFSSRGAAANEGAVYWICTRNSGEGSIAPGPDYFYVRYGFNGGGLANYGIIQPVDRDYLSKWFPGGADGLALKTEGRRQLNDAGDLGGAWDGCSFTYRLDDTENYRNYFIPGLRRSMDQWEPFIKLCEIMDRRKTPDSVFDSEIGKILDVEQFLRVIGVRILTSDWDAFGVGNGHNGVLVYDSGDLHWKLLPFDVDNSWSNVGAPLFPTGDGDVARLMARPWARRLYFQILTDYAAGYWSATTARPYLTAVQTASGISTTAILSYLGTSNRNIATATKSAATATLRFTTGDGTAATVEGTKIDLEGDAPLAARRLLLSLDGAEPVPFEVTWTTPSHWKASLDLTHASTSLVLRGLDKDGEVVAEAAFEVVSSAFGAVFTRGDADRDGRRSITDAIVTLRYLFQGGQVTCPDACDADDDGKVALTDAVVLLDHLFREGGPLPAPFPGQGVDATEDELGCD